MIIIPLLVKNTSCIITYAKDHSGAMRVVIVVNISNSGPTPDNEIVHVMNDRYDKKSI